MYGLSVLKGLRRVALGVVGCPCGSHSAGKVRSGSVEGVTWPSCGPWELLSKKSGRQCVITYPEIV